MAKSEPAHAMHSSADGAQDSETTPVSSGEGQAVMQPALATRRVSAPSDPPIGSQESRGRYRRARHWRLKNRAADNGASGSGSRAGTTSSSGTTSSDQVSTDEMTAAPVTTPAEGVQMKIPVIRFAPEC